MILDKRADLRHGDVKKLLFSLSVPTITSQIVNMLYNLVDRVFIGHMQPAETVGKLALTGVGVCLPIIMVISAFASLMAIGGAPRATLTSSTLMELFGVPIHLYPDQCDPEDPGCPQCGVVSEAEGLLPNYAAIERREAARMNARLASRMAASPCEPCGEKAPDQGGSRAGSQPYIRAYFHDSA